MAGKSSSKRVLNPFEALGALDDVLGGIPGAFTDSIKKDLIGKKTVDTAAKQVVGHGLAEKSHEKPVAKGGPVKMEAGKPVHLGKKEANGHEKPSAEKKLHIRAGNEYHGDMARISERAVSREQQEHAQQLKEIRAEIARFMSSLSTVLKNEYKEIAVDQAPASPGRYHTNFLEWVLINIRTARQKVEDGGAWLAAVQSRKGQKGYKHRAKHEGTKFTQNMDRNVATSVG